jgi:hypothetical protein
MASGSAMRQDSLLVSLGGDGASILLPLAHIGFRVKKQIKRQPMAGELAPEGPVQTQVRDGRSSGRSSIQGGILVIASPGRHPGRVVARKSVKARKGGRCWAIGKNKYSFKLEVNKQLKENNVF